MLRRALIEKAPEIRDGFRMRGTEVSRMEGFADSIFGFGLTLLVVSLEIPKSYKDLIGTMRGFVAFGICFAVFYYVWARHYIFCRRYGLEDFPVHLLTAILLFVMLAYLYPMKFLTVLFVQYVLKIDVGALKIEAPHPTQVADLFLLYGVGAAAIQLVFYLLYGYAYAQREKLRLDALERLDTRWWTYEQLALLLVPLLSVSIALFAPAGYIHWAGYCYFLMGVVAWLCGVLQGRSHRKMVERMRLNPEELSTTSEQIEVPPTPVA